MSDWTDQHGNTVTFEQLIDQISESILANLIAFDRAGISRNQIQQIIGSDGGTLIGGGAMLQTPVASRLTQDQGKELFMSYKRLLEAYDRGEIATSVVDDLTTRNNTTKKTEMIIRHVRGT